MELNDILCTICNELLILPRLYDHCGHTFCEDCMKKNDIEDKNKIRNIFDQIYYKCPICRCKTIKSWYERPLNHSLIDILEKNPKYKELEQKMIDNRTDIDNKNINDIDDIDNLHNINLSFILIDTKKKKVNELYQYLLPLLYKNVKEGKSIIVIKERAEELRLVCDLISEKLINNHNVYKITSTNVDFTIEFIPTKIQYKFEYVNNNYENNLNTRYLENTQIYYQDERDSDNEDSNSYVV